MMCKIATLIIIATKILNNCGGFEGQSIILPVILKIVMVVRLDTLFH
tara:strand:+ start:208 stop:348 length:141 start_codon:yes stop_codon:yes gene_type:complete